ncbi:MAG: DUF6265 family protein [Saprospiraceae bacterium]|nr:DUF6265 family protein [Saprospiraceae bacterium]
MKKLSTVMLLTVALLSCQNRLPQQASSTNPSLLQPFKWMLGDWERSFSTGKMAESWQWANDSTMIGASFVIRNGDTVSYESISLEARKGEVLYVPTVRNQNNQEPVYFRLKSNENGWATFENPEHDFPQRIIYTQKGVDTLYARIEGISKGKERASEFVMAKKQ